MSYSGNRQWDVLIGGTGIAAASVALLLLARGIRPLLVATARRPLPGIEAIPEAGLALFSELGILHVLKNAGAEVFEGFENQLRDAQLALPGRWVHVDRSRLADGVLREALRNGAGLRTCSTLPQISRQAADYIEVFLDGERLRCGAAIDATGRSAVWSRPILRRGRQAAELFRVEGEAPQRGRVVTCSRGWSYRIGLPGSTTVAVVTDNHPSKLLPEPLWLALGLSSKSFEFVGQRPAFPQWAERPVRGRILAVGDAAFACDPIAGQGICFALASSFAAAAVVNTWLNSPAQSTAAEQFYLAFVEQRRLHHLEALGRLAGTGRAPRSEWVDLDDRVRFTGHIAISALQKDSRIVEGDVVLLSDGTKVRWVGGVDLLRISELTRTPISIAELLRLLVSGGMESPRASAVVQWCVQQQVIGNAEHADDHAF